MLQNIKGKNRAKGFKISLAKITKKSSKKRLPVSKYNTTTMKKTVIKSTHYNVVNQSNEEKGRRLSVNSYSLLDDSFDVKKFNKDNENNSVVSIISAQTYNWVPMNHKQNELLMNNQFLETPRDQNKEVPNTSSPKEFSPNFTMNTELSQISDLLRSNYRKVVNAAVTIQKAYRAYVRGKRQLLEYTTLKIATTTELTKIRRETAAICIQKHFRRYLVQSRYQYYRHQVLFIQKLWRGKLATRLLHCEYNQKRRIIIKLQARIRGYLVRAHIQSKKEDILRMKEEKKRHWAANVIQAYFRGHKVRVAMDTDSRVTELRRRWREGALKSTQKTLIERHEQAMDGLRHARDIDTVITYFESLNVTTQILPSVYITNATAVVRKIYTVMSGTNRSKSSIEVLQLAASVLVNLTRYRGTGPKIYARDRIDPILKFMLRFSNSEPNLLCMLSTYLWLFSKYDGIREDLTEYLNIRENKKILTSIKNNVQRLKRMLQNGKQVSQTRSCRINKGKGIIILPAIEPDYGINHANTPHYFVNNVEAITCLFQTFDL